MNHLKNYIFVLLSVVLLLNCTKEKSKNKVDEVESFSMELSNDSIQIAKRNFKDNEFGFTELLEKKEGTSISATGMIEVPPNGRAVISAQVGGYIKNAQLLIGDQVTKGSFLVNIENIEFLELQQKYLETLEELTFLESNYQRQSELYKEKISSEKSYLKAQSDYKKTVAVYTGLKKKLELLNISPSDVENGKLTAMSSIYAPISGNISEINVKTGSYVDASNPIMEIVNTEHVHLEIKIFEKDALHVKKGQKVLFSLPESSKDTYSGSVHLIGTSIGSDRTVTAHVHMDEEKGTEFIPGMFVQAQVVLEDALLFYIPTEAVFNLDGHSYLLKLESESESKETYHFKRVEILTGKSFEGLLEVLNSEKFDKKDRYLLRIN